eukprot:CAMPEP_0201218050 /NCGR_PEP_ID=MMETSP0851-20130426/190379_1 /ASSEMBLY_ACC=CAM_ASM_000631 /TAXON_ID=183588 /ORGANISM="Pseudo-nitzschia fraudulenta, Strain WWA7" /LENGTH=263 /DNA_ID=CAMNT_0047507725 /DNA_START=504 /DNA_END=1298 /DNA_ORIENTATION=-
MYWMDEYGRTISESLHGSSTSDAVAAAASQEETNCNNNSSSSNPLLFLLNSSGTKNNNNNPIDNRNGERRGTAATAAAAAATATTATTTTGRSSSSTPPCPPVPPPPVPPPQEQDAPEVAKETLPATESAEPEEEDVLPTDIGDHEPNINKHIKDNSDILNVYKHIPDQKCTVFWIKNQKCTSQSPRTLTLVDEASPNALDGLNVEELIRNHSMSVAAPPAVQRQRNNKLIQHPRNEEWNLYNNNNINNNPLLLLLNNNINNQ